MSLSNPSTILQQAYILATGTAASPAQLAELQALVTQDNGGYSLVAQHFETMMDGVAAAQGSLATAKSIALNGFGQVLSDADATSIMNMLHDQGITTWAQILEFCVLLQGSLGNILDNRAAAATGFDAELTAQNKAGLYAGATVQAAVHNFLQEIDASQLSLSHANAGLQVVVDNLSAGGLTATALDGYIANAQVFVDTNGNGVLDTGEFHTTTNASGDYTIPAAQATGTVVVTGGTDLLTGHAFLGTLTALPGSTMASPMSSMVQAMLASGVEGSTGAAVTALAQALGLPTGVDLLSYDPLAVLADASATAADKAVALKVLSVSLELANVMTELAATIDVANAKAGHPSSSAAEVAAALAGAIAAAAAQNGGTGTIDLTSSTVLSGIVATAATAAGATDIVAHAGDVAQIIAASNAAAAGASTITTLSQVAVVSQGQVVGALETAALNGTWAGAVASFTGANLTSLINAQIPGVIEPGMPVPQTPIPPFVPTFFIVLSGTVVTFYGTQTGDITVSWSGATDASVATFSRNGLAADRTITFPSEGSSISLTGTQTLSASASQIQGVPIAGAGTVKITDTAILASTLLSLDAAISCKFDASAVTAITGSAADVLSVYASTIIGLGDEAVTLTDTTLAATDLNSIDGSTTGVVDASSVTTLTGLADDVAASYAANTAGTISGLGNEAVTLSDTTLAAATLNTIDADTSGVVDASAATTLTGTAADVAAAYAANTAGTISGLGDEAVTLSDTTLDSATLNTIDAATSGVVDASAATTLTGLAADVAASYAANTAGTISGLGDEAVTLTDTTLACATLNTIDAATSGVVDASAATTLTGLASDVIAAYDANTAGTVSGLGDEAVTLSDTTLAAADLNTVDGDTSGVVDASAATTLTGTASDVLAAYAANTAGTVSGLGNEAVTLSDTTLAATDLNAVDSKTTGVVNASSVTTLTGLADDVAASYAANTAGTISGLGNEAVTLSDTTLASATLNTIDAATSGVVNASAATTLTGLATDVAASYAANTAGTISGLGNEAVTLSDTTLACATLNTINAATTGVVNASAATTLTGLAADVIAAYNANTAGTVSGLGNEAVTLSDTTLAAADLNTVDGDTSGVVDASAATTLTGTAADVLAAYAANTAGTVSGLGNEAVTLSDTTLAATDLNAVDSKTTGVVNASSVTTLTGLADDVAASYAANTAGTISGLGNEAVTLSDTTLASATLNTIDSATSGVVNASAATTLTGLATDVAASYAANTAGTISGLGNEAVTLSDTTLACATLNTIDAATTGVVNASAATTLTGLAADVIAAYNANTAGTVSGLGNEAVTLSDTTLAAADLNTVDGDTSGVVDASAATTLTGTASDVLAAYAANTAGTVSGLGNEAVTLSDTTLAATDLNAVDSKTSGVVDAGTVTTLTGLAADVAASYAANTAGTISGLGDEAVTLSDTTLASATLNTIDSATSGVVDASAATTLTGTASDVAASYAANTAGTVSGLGNEAVTLSDTTLACATLNTIDAATSGVVDASAATTLTGLAADVLASYAANALGTVSGLGNENVVVSDTAAAAADLLTLDADNTTGTVDATGATSINGTAAAILNVMGASSILKPTDYGCTVSNTTVQAADLLSIDTGNGTGTVDATAATLLKGLTVDVLAALADTNITFSGSEDVKVTDAIDVADANTVAAATTGIVTATLSDHDLPTLTKLTVESNNAYTISVTDTSIKAADLTYVDSATTVAVKAGPVATISGTAAEVETLYGEVTAGTVTGLGNEAVTVTDTSIAVADANIIAAATTGAVTATITETDLATLIKLSPGETNNYWTVTVGDATAFASYLNTVDAATKVVVTATAVTTINGLAADVKTALNSTGITGLGDEAVTLTDSVLDASTLNKVDQSTTGVVDASAAGMLTGTASTVKVSYDNNTAGTTTGLGNEAVTLTDTTLSASTLNIIDGDTGGVVYAIDALTLTGNAATVAASYAANTAGTISGLGDEAVTLSDTTLAADVLNTINAATTGVVNASAATTLSGPAADIQADYTAAGKGEISGLDGSENLTATDTNIAVATANALAALTTGVVKATITEGDLTTLKTLTETTNNYTIVLTDSTGVLATDLSAVDGKTIGKIDASSVLDMKGSAAEVDAVYQSNGFTGLGNEAVALTTNPNVSEANTVDADTSGIITATITDTTVSTLKTLTGKNNAYSITVKDASVLATEINTVDAATTVLGGVDVTAVGTLEGLLTDVNKAYTSTGITGWSSSLNVTLDDTTISAASLNTADGITSGTVDATAATSVTGKMSDLLTAVQASGIKLNNPNLTVSDTTLLAADILTLDSKTSGSIDVSASTKISGTASDLETLYTNAPTDSILGLGNENDVVIDATTSYVDANKVAGATTGVVTAKIAEGDLASLVQLVDAQINAYTITISDTTNVSASDLNYVNAQTSVKVAAGAVLSITGASTDIDTLYKAASTDFTGLGNEAITVTDSISVSEANGIDGYTTGAVTATLSDKSIATLTGLTGTNNNYTITISDTSILATDLNKVDAADALVAGINVAAVTDVEGLLADVTTARTSTGITGWSGTLNVKLDDTSVVAASLNTADSFVGGTLDANSVTSLSGLAADLLAAYGSAGITGLGDENVTITDTALLASDALSVDSKTSGTVAVNATKLTGTAADIKSVYSNAYGNLGDESVVVTDTIAYADANTIAADTTGIVTATVSDTLANLVKLTDTQTNAYTITLSDTSAAAADITTVDGQTSVKLDASSVTSISGTSAEIDAVYAENKAGTVKGLGNEAVSVSDGISVTEAGLIDGYTSGAVTATITDHALATLIGLAGTTNNAWTTSLNDSSVAAADLITLDKATTVAIDASSVTGTVSGTGADIKTVFTSLGITGLGAAAASVSDSLTVANANTVAAATTGIVTSTISDTLLSKLITLTETNNAYTVTTSDTTGKAADINTVDSHTTVSVNATSLATITGGFSDFTTLAAAVSGSQVSLSGTANVQITDTAAALTGQTWSATGASDQLSVGATSGSPVDLTKLTGFETIKLGGGLDLVTIADGAGSSITASAASNVTMGASGQTFTGSGGNDTVVGGSGADNINGGGGADNINGGAGSDTILGGNGNDTIVGGAGADVITGGAGKDTIDLATGDDSSQDTVVIDSNLAANADTITGFVSGEDKLDFSIASLGLAASYTAGSVTFQTKAQADTLTSGQWTNMVLVDTLANIKLTNLGSHSGATAALAYDSSTGNIYYDADGDFSTGIVLIGTVTTHAIAAGDIAMI